MNACEIQKPRFQTMPLAEGLKLRAGGGWTAMEKKDGCWCVREWRGHVLTGEQMPDGTFWPFDVCAFAGEDVRRQQWRTRREMLAELRHVWPEDWREIPTGTGAEFLEAVLSRGGEGVVLKHLDSFFGVNWWKIKREITEDAVILARHTTRQSVLLGQYADGQLVPCGWCACTAADKWQRAAVGSVVEIKAHSRTAKNAFREPRIARFRTDKQPADCIANL